MPSWEVLILCLHALTTVTGSHMQGGLITFRPRGKNPDGTFAVYFKYKAAFNFQNDYEITWYCYSGDCGYEVHRTSELVEQSSYPNQWYQTEGRFVRHLYSSKPFQLSDISCCWVSNHVGASGWSLITAVDLGTRSDNAKPNSSPVTTIIPKIRVPQNCPTSFNLMANDPDGDIVQCRYGDRWAGECVTCYQHPAFNLNKESCVLSLLFSMPIGSYVFELVLEDFPRRDIYLTHTDGSVIYKYRPYVRNRRSVPKQSRWYYWTDSYTDVTSDLMTDTMDTSVTDHFTFDDETSSILENSPESNTPDSTIYDSTAVYGTTVTELISVTKESTYETMRETIDVTGVETTADWYLLQTTTDIGYVTETVSPTHDPTSTHSFITEDEQTRLDTTEIPELITAENIPKHTTRDTLLSTLENTPESSTPDIYPSTAAEDDKYDTTQSILEDTTVVTETKPVSEVLTDRFPESSYRTTAETYHTHDVTLLETTPEWHFPQTTTNIVTGSETAFTADEPSFNSLSKIPLQFIVEVTSNVGSCEYGVFRPKFISPTPNQGETLRARARTPFQLHLSAQATHDRIEDFQISGPANMTRRFTLNTRSSTTKSMIVEWTPSDSDVEDHVPFCFIAETVDGHHSEFRCVLVIVDSADLPNTALICNENTMTLIIEKSATNGLYDNHLRLNDPACLVSSNTTHHIASVEFNSCGTTVEETEHEIVFKNQITSFDSATAVISRKHQVIIPFNCSFPKESRVSAAFRAEKAVFEFTEAGFGNFTYNFQFYTDDQFTTVQTQSPLEVWLRDMLYMEIQVASSLPNVQLFVESCKATPHDNPNDPVFYNIIENGCLKDETLINFPGTRTQLRFGIEAFAFIGDYEEVYVSCTVILCKLGDPNTRCAQGCTSKSSETNAHRRRRSLTSESLQHFISQGPLRMKRQSPNQDSDGKVELNVNSLVVSLSGVVVVALVAVTINMSMRKARMTKYEKLPTEEL
ncbi:Hypothetical predicted protein [Pelobates cultripes]|uniref:ZP domain-containing protein n=1 Tax=Pelobates cultripes TaxID=61616 RepID=A0AAD1TJD0_PELCU|nr:Hypothetical predicted protein [Pelobates cultripes]